MNELKETQELVPFIPPVKVNALIRYGASGEKVAFQATALEIAELWKKAGNEEVYLWILAQFGLVNTWVPM